MSCKRACADNAWSRTHFQFVRLYCIHCLTNAAAGWSDTVATNSPNVALSADLQNDGDFPTIAAASAISTAANAWGLSTDQAKELTASTSGRAASGPRLGPSVWGGAAHTSLTQSSTAASKSKSGGKWSSLLRDAKTGNPTSAKFGKSRGLRQREREAAEARRLAEELSGHSALEILMPLSGASGGGGGAATPSSADEVSTSVAPLLFPCVLYASIVRRPTWSVLICSD